MTPRSEPPRAPTDVSFLAAIVDSSDDAIIGKDRNGIISSWNPAAERLFGYSAAEAVGRPIAILAPPDRPNEMPSILARLKRGERIEHFDTIRRAKNGRLVPVSLTVSPIKDENGIFIGASKILRDISERLLATAALAEERSRLRATLMGIGDAVIVTDAVGRVTLLNPIAQTLTGWKDDAIGRPLVDVFRIVNEQSGQSVESPVERALREGAIVGLANHTVLIARDGSRTPIDDSAAPILDAGGRVLGVVMVFRDVSVRRTMEEALKAADRRKDEFLATLAHELRNPLAPIFNAAEVLIRDPAGQDAPWCRDVIDRQVRHMARLLDDLLDVSRITHRKLELRKERIDLASVVECAIETSRPLVDERRQRLSVLLPSERVILDADPVRLAQVFWNLLNNAARYSPRGSEIRLGCERRGGEVVVSVKDQGMGIDAEMLPRLFEIFSQSQAARRHSQGGLGIGLSLARGVVDLHGGTIEARSDGPGQGSEFIVRLPVAADAPATTTPAIREAESKARTKQRFLIVDDLKDSADSLAMLLRLMGHDVATAYDGEAAIAAAQDLEPDVILLDLGMPKLNGYETCRQIRRQPLGKKPLVIALTGWGQQADRRLTREAGFDGHLVKPADPDVLMEVVERLKPAG